MVVLLQRFGEGNQLAAIDNVADGTRGKRM